jgi:hypothetical protein
LALYSGHNRVFRYTLTGNHDLEPGSFYRIEYVNRVKILWISLRLALWGGRLPQSIRSSRLEPVHVDLE